MGDREVVAIAVYTDGCERLPDGSLLIHDCLNSSQARRLVAAPADIAPWPDAERLASLQAERDRLAEEKAQRMWSPLGDNHHNAAACPYCQGDEGRGTIAHAVASARDLREKNATLEAQLALCDAVVEAARLRRNVVLSQVSVTNERFRSPDKWIAIPREDFDNLRTALADLAASENPRGATP